MKKYDVEYIDKRGDQQDYVVTSTDVRSAIADALHECPDARRIISCILQHPNENPSN